MICIIWNLPWLLPQHISDHSNHQSVTVVWTTKDIVNALDGNFFNDPPTINEIKFPKWLWFYRRTYDEACGRSSRFSFELEIFFQCSVFKRKLYSEFTEHVYQPFQMKITKMLNCSLAIFLSTKLMNRLIWTGWFGSGFGWNAF